MSDYYDFVLSEEFTREVRTALKEGELAEVVDMARSIVKAIGLDLPLPPMQPFEPPGMVPLIDWFTGDTIHTSAAWRAANTGDER